MFGGSFNPYYVVRFCKGVVDPRLNDREYTGLASEITRCKMALLHAPGDEELLQELEKLKCSLTAFYMRNPLNPRRIDDRPLDPDGIVYLFDDRELLKTVNRHAVSESLLCN